jgi:plasmid stabilization system protein ParE
MAYTLSRSAVLTIEEIARYTDDNFGAAQTADYVGGLYSSFGRIAQWPELGRPIGKADRRLIVYRQHYVLYRLEGDDVFILDLLNVRQNIPSDWEIG